MRVWALASCGGLLALAAFSAEQSNSPAPGAATADGDDTPQVDAPSKSASPGTVVRSGVQPRTGLTATSRPQLSLVQSAARGGDPTRPSSPQANQLRERLQQLQQRRSASLPSSRALVTAPAPSALTAPTPSRPQFQTSPGSSGVQPETVAIPRPSPVPTPGLSKPARSGQAAPLTATARPPLAAPEVLDGPAGTTSDLAAVAAATGAQGLPLAPVRHQGHSARAHLQPVVLDSPAPLTATARLHDDASALSLEQAEIAIAPTQPEVDTPAEHQASNAELGPNQAAAAAAQTVSPPQTTHQSSGTPILTLSRSGDADAVVQAAGSHQEQESTLASSTAAPELVTAPPTALSASSVNRSASDRATPTAGAITQPESLPLATPAPQLSPRRSSSAVGIESSAETAAIAPAHTGTVPAPVDIALSTESPTAAHRGQVSSAAVRLTPPVTSAPKGLPDSHCLAVGEIPVAPGIIPADSLAKASQPETYPDQPHSDHSAASHCSTTAISAAEFSPPPGLD
jgi:hypothetical protein